MKWKDFFEGRILERGYGYYRSGNVRDLLVRKDEITAVVEGTEEYDVSITLDGGEIEDMECTCPYAEDGTYCKHMAAVLYTAEREPVTVSCTASEVENFVEQADVSELKQFLVEILQKDDALFLKLKSSLVKRPEEVDLNRYQKQIDRTIRNYSGRYDYIEYSDAGDFINKMSEYLDEDIQKLIDHHLLESAFALSGYLFVKVSAVDMDDSDGDRGEFGCHCRDVWKTILNQSDTALQEKIFCWMIEHLDGSVTDYMEEYIEEFILGEFQEPEYLRRKLLYTEQRASQIPWSDSWQYEREQWARYHIMLMKQLDFRDQEILDYCRKYWEHDKIRRYCIDFWLEQGNDAEAISILEESLKLDEKSPGLIAEYRRELKELYRKNGNQELYQQHLYRLVIDSHKPEDLRELKLIYSSEEWLTVRESIFSETPAYYIADLYVEEGLYDRLLNYVMKERDIYALEKYETILSQHYPEQVLKKYQDFLMKSALNVADRKTYQRWADILRHMVSMQGGKEVVKKILEEWHCLYPRRKAMMQEIDKLKMD